MGYSSIGHDEFLYNIVKLQAHGNLLTKSVEISISKKDQEIMAQGRALFMSINQTGSSHGAT
ncbi:putative uncharacterized protein [Pseudomonas sp. St290]|nr:putative uncharacterized protein [Pseudomonas sp. St290]